MNTPSQQAEPTDALVKEIMAEMSPHSAMHHQWFGWPGTFAFAQAAIRVFERRNAQAAAVAQPSAEPDELYDAWVGRLFDGFSTLMGSAEARGDINGKALAKSMRDSFAALLRALRPAGAGEPTEPSEANIVCGMCDCTQEQQNKCFVLHPATDDLVDRFALALKSKLFAAEVKYGYSDGWRGTAWMDECRAKLMEHIGKGDPRDVAAYCAFLWHHGESTAGAVAAPAVREPSDILVTQEDVDKARAIILDCTGTDAVSGNRPVQREDRAWLYDRLCEAAGLLIGSVPAVEGRDLSELRSAAQEALHAWDVYNCNDPVEEMLKTSAAFDALRAALSPLPADRGDAT